MSCEPSEDGINIGHTAHLEAEALYLIEVGARLLRCDVVGRHASDDFVAGVLGGEERQCALPRPNLQTRPAGQISLFADAGGLLL